MATGPVLVSIHARHGPLQLWIYRLGQPLITLLGLYIASITWTDGAPVYVAAFGFAVGAFGVWLQFLVELVPRNRLCIVEDGSIRIRAGTLLRRDVVLRPAEIRSISYCEQTINAPKGAHTVTILGKGGYLRIELDTPRILTEARWTNFIWYLTRESDPVFTPPPLPHREVHVLHFSAAPEDGNLVAGKAQHE
jgi:hypothetical protein